MEIDTGKDLLLCTRKIDRGQDDAINIRRTPGPLLEAESMAAAHYVGVICARSEPRGTKNEGGLWLFRDNDESRLLYEEIYPAKISGTGLKVPRFIR